MVPLVLDYLASRADSNRNAYDHSRVLAMRSALAEAPLEAAR